MRNCSKICDMKKLLYLLAASTQNQFEYGGNVEPERRCSKIASEGTSAEFLGKIEISMEGETVFPVQRWEDFLLHATDVSRPQ